MPTLTVKKHTKTKLNINKHIKSTKSTKSTNSIYPKNQSNNKYYNTLPNYYPIGDLHSSKPLLYKYYNISKQINISLPIYNKQLNKLNYILCYKKKLYNNANNEYKNGYKYLYDDAINSNMKKKLMKTHKQKQNMIGGSGSISSEARKFEELYNKLPDCIPISMFPYNEYKIFYDTNTKVTEPVDTLNVLTIQCYKKKPLDKIANIKTDKYEFTILNTSIKTNKPIDFETYNRLKNIYIKKQFKPYVNNISDTELGTIEDMSYIPINLPSKEENYIIDISKKQIITPFELTLLKSYYDSFNLLKDTPTKTYLQNYLPHEMGKYVISAYQEPNEFEYLTTERIPLEYTKQETET